MPSTCSLHSYLELIAEDSVDRILFSEAVNAASAGALRGAYILIWLSAAEGLKRRFYATGNRDHTVRIVCEKLDKLEEGHRAIDSTLITEAKNYGLITSTEETRLRYIYQLRCVYGHPYEEAPSSESVIAAARDVTEIVLSRPIRYRQAYLNERVRLLTTDKNFLDDVRASVDGYAVEVYSQLHESLHGELLVQLWKKLLPFATEPSQDLFFRRGVWFAKGFLKVGGESLMAQLDPTGILITFPQVVATVFSEPQVFRLLNAHAQDIVISIFLEPAANATERLHTIVKLDEEGTLSERQRERFQNAIDEMSFTDAIEVGIPMKYYTERIIKDLKSHDWYTQNPAIAAITYSGSKKTASLPIALQIELGNNVLQSADGKARSAVNFIRALPYSSSSDWPVDFIRGIVFECFINLETNKIRFKDEFLTDVLSALTSLKEEDNATILNSLLLHLSQGEMAPTVFRSNFTYGLQKTIKKVEHASQRHSQLKPLITWLETCPTPKFAYDEDE